jgi:ribonuclease D
MQWALEIRTKLKAVLENPDVVVVMYNAENDIKILKRDFFIFLVGVVDIQQLQINRMQKDSPFKKLNLRPSDLRSIRLQNLLHVFAGNSYVLAHGEKQKFQMFDWEMRRTLTEEAKDYVIHDVFWLHRIWLWIKKRVKQFIHS